MKLQTRTVDIKGHTLHLLLPRYTRHGQIKWYVTPKDCRLSDENIVEEGESTTPYWAERDAKNALFNSTGNRD